MRFKTIKEENNEGNIFWITMTDLMTALTLVFIVLFVFAYMSNFQNKTIPQYAQQEAANTLQEALAKQNIDADVDIKAGVVKIQDLELFEVNSYTLSPKGKLFLSKFAPAYIDSLFSNEYLSSNLDKIVIQGHTDSQTFVGKYSEDEQYMKNMELSLKRAYTVANFMTSTPYNKVNGNKLRKMIIVEGASFSDPIMINNKEDFSKSRRVELKLVMKPQKN